MEVSGKKLPAHASVFDTTYCQPCSHDGDILTAEAYCTVCKEFMCSGCANFHRKQKLLKSHTLFDKSNMPTTMSGTPGVQQSTEPCDIHPEEFIKYFCPSHQSLNCGHCSVLEHKSCDIQIITDICKAFKDGQEHDDIKQDIVKMLADIKDCAGDVEIKRRLITEMAEDEISNVREYRDKVNKYFAEREHSLLKMVEQMRKTDETMLDFLKPKCDHIEANVEELRSKLEAQEEDTAQLFIEAKRVQKQIKTLKSALLDINKDMSIHQYRFRKDPVTEHMLASSTGLGTVEEVTLDTETVHERLNQRLKEQDSKPCKQHIPEKRTPKPGVTDQEQDVQTVASVDLTSLKFTPAPSIPVKFLSDTKDCWLSSTLLLPGDRLLLADFNNFTVKLVNLQTSSLVSHISLPGRPWDMCLLPGDRMSVSLSNGTIQVLETQGQLSLGDNIKVDGDCRGIGCHSDRLIVSYFSGKVEMMDMSGKVIKKIENDDRGKSVFCRPLYLTVVSEGQTAAIYLSDYENNTISKLDMELNILQTFHGTALIGCRCITAVGNQLIVCGLKINNIMCLDLPTNKMTQLLEKNEQIHSPWSVCYSQQKHKLYVTCYPSSDSNFDWNNLVHVYKSKSH